MTMHRTMILLTSLTALVASSAFAQTVSNTSTTPQSGAVFEKMTPAQKEAKRAEMKEKLKSMTPEERKQFVSEKKAQWQKRYDSATPEQQAKMKARMEKRQAARQAKHGGSSTQQ